MARLFSLRRSGTRRLAAQALRRLTSLLHAPRAPKPDLRPFPSRRPQTWHAARDHHGCRPHDRRVHQAATRLILSGPALGSARPNSERHVNPHSFENAVGRSMSGLPTLTDWPLSSVRRVVPPCSVAHDSRQPRHAPRWTPEWNSDRLTSARLPAARRAPVPPMTKPKPTVKNSTMVKLPGSRRSVVTGVE